ncbi:MAG TPA: hypothetical protein ENN87_13225 [Phycisphaerales bacterium]|nr:hypothetical protein [Phycisphaerales bacterium]
MFRSGSNVLLVLAVGLVWSCPGCRGRSPGQEPAFEVRREYQRGPLTVAQRLDRTRIPLYGLLTVELQMTVEDGYEVDLPAVPTDLDKFRLRDWRDLGRARTDEAHTTRTVRYHFEPLEPGAWYLPAFEVAFRPRVPDAGGQRTLATEPFEITVVSLIDEQGGELSIGPIDDVVAPRRSAWVYIAMAAGVVILAAVGSLLWWRRRRRRRAGPPRVLQAAHVIARGRLDALAESGLVEAGRFEPFYAQVSNILRHYIEDRFGLRAPEQTTEEFLVELRHTDELDAATRGDLGRFLEHCDLVKFARQSATAEQMAEALDLVRRFVEHTADDRYKVDVATGQRVIEMEAA